MLDLGLRALERHRQARGQRAALLPPAVSMALTGARILLETIAARDTLLAAVNALLGEAV
ncbi:hypothetical protein JL100_018130 [Skermanella mucosa]|uniref:hypothetical protein n=1 Tax=Skermanella mucosa TaxID=1789672 RepID=UPI00192B5A41|nr:hypothetical protein [Skermanella mucosa]UEM19005.1 hypothetical protein JL100_018130 [Skermanella mucosa]